MPQDLEVLQQCHGRPALHICVSHDKASLGASAQRSRQGDTRWAGLHPSILHQALPRWALLTTVGPRGAAAAAWTEMGQVRHS